MNTNNPKNADHHDRLLDTALREVVGGETPPDLSEKILAAAGEKSPPLATLGDDAMTKKHQQSRRKRNVYIGAALAASLLVAAGLLFPKGLKQATQEVANSKTLTPAVKTETSLETKPEKPAETTVELPEFEMVPVETTVTVPDGVAVLDGGIKTEFLRRVIDQNKKEKLMMAVTPHIIIQEEEEQRLKVKVHPVPDLVLPVPATGKQPGQIKLESLGNDVYAGALIKKQIRGRAAKNRSGGTQGQRFRIDASPGQNVQRYNFFARDGGGYGGEMGGYGGRSPTTPAEPHLTAEADSGLYSSAAPALIARRSEVSRQLREKIEKYHTLASELGGGESPIVSTKLSGLINDVSQTQTEIIKAKEELNEIAVARAVAEQQTRSSSVLEQAVAQTLDKDPMLKSYHADEFSLMAKIRSAKSSDGKTTSRELKRLMLSLGDLKQESHKYRMVVERDVRAALKASPNDFLSEELTEHILRRNMLQEKIAKLEKQYVAKYAELKNNSDRSGQLSLLEAEIEQLQKLERGQAPNTSGDRYTRIYENPFLAAKGEQAVSTFSIDVDTASYANVRQFLLQSGQLPPPDAVRIEELINYFSYDYTAPTDDTPFAAPVEVAGCPWHPQHRLVRVGIKGHEIAGEKRPQSNLVFLIDVSGSMNQPNKLPLLVEGLKMLTRQLGENDRVAIVVYASSEGLALPSTRGDEQAVILAALEKLRAGGSTAGGAGIQLAYRIAQENFIEGGVNRVILATDGDFNVGTTNKTELERLAESNAQETGVFLTVLGFGRGNLNDAMMEAISGKGNGNYHYVDNRAEARKVLVEEIAGTLVTIAKDVKIQIEFNPAQVAAYRLIGYENRMLETQDFNDDKKDAGEIGAGHTVTAIYEVVPAGVAVETPKVDPLKYQPRAETTAPVKQQLRAEAAAPTEPAKTPSDADASDELLTLKLRYKQPDGDRSTKLEFPITDNGQTFAEATDDFKFASAVASFGMLLRHSEHSGNASYAAVLEIAEDGGGKDLRGYRAEFLQLVRQAKVLAGE